MMGGGTGSESMPIQASDVMCSFDGGTARAFLGWVHGATLRTIRELESSKAVSSMLKIRCRRRGQNRTPL